MTGFECMLRRGRKGLGGERREKERAFVRRGNKKTETQVWFMMEVQCVTILDYTTCVLHTPRGCYLHQVYLYITQIKGILE